MDNLSVKSGISPLGQKAQQLYARLRPQIETPENIGKLIVMEVESGDYEIDEKGIETSRRLQNRHPEATLYALRIGYKAVETLGGIRERSQVHPESPLEGQTMADFFKGYVGVISSSEFVPGGAQMSQDTGRKFTEGMIRKRHEGNL